MTDKQTSKEDKEGAAGTPTELLLKLISSKALDTPTMSVMSNLAPHLFGNPGGNPSSLGHWRQDSPHLGVLSCPNKYTGVPGTHTDNTLYVCQ